MNKDFSDILSTLFDCVHRISESNTLTSQQQDDLQEIKSLGEDLGRYFDNVEREVNGLKQKLKIADLPRRNRNIDCLDTDEISSLQELIFFRTRQLINIDELLDMIALEVYHHVQSDQVIVYQLSNQDQGLIKYEVVHSSNRSLLGQRLPSIYTDPEWIETCQRFVSRVINDVSAPDIDPKISESLIPLGIHSAIAIAIPSGKNLWGLLILHHYDSPRDWQDWEIELLEKIGTQLAISIHQMQLLVKSDAIKLERDQIIAKLQHNQLHDSLTELPNRDLFMKSLDLAFAEFQANSSRNFAVLFIDCDRFKMINANFDVATGDQLLKEISDRLNTFKGINITIARIESDEFAFLIENIDSKDKAIRLAEQVSESIKQPFSINDNLIIISVSIGIAVSKSQYIHANDILRDANVAMHHSRKLGRGKLALFDSEMNQGAKVRWQLENDLRQALDHQELYLVYQPIVSLHDRNLIGFEVLVRWLHPLYGSISPIEFIPIAEQTGEIVQIGYWVLETACNQLSQWQKSFPNMPSLTLGVNVSTIQVVQPDFVEHIQKIFLERQISPNLINLEITESVLMGNIEISSQKLEQLRAIGIQIYIDDFGTGHSSFSYLQNLPIDALKIDRSFTNKIFTDSKSQRIIQSMLRLANNLGIGIVVEGVETSEELDYFEGIGGSSIEIQGYFISHPLNSEKATQWIQETSL